MQQPQFSASVDEASLAIRVRGKVNFLSDHTHSCSGNNWQMPTPSQAPLLVQKYLKNLQGFPCFSENIAGYD